MLLQSFYFVSIFPYDRLASLSECKFLNFILSCAWWEKMVWSLSFAHLKGLWYSFWHAWQGLKSSSRLDVLFFVLPRCPIFEHLGCLVKSFAWDFLISLDVFFFHLSCFLIFEHLGCLVTLLGMCSSLAFSMFDHWTLRVLRDTFGDVFFLGLLDVQPLKS